MYSLIISFDTFKNLTFVKDHVYTEQREQTAHFPRIESVLGATLKTPWQIVFSWDDNNFLCTYMEGITRGFTTYLLCLYKFLSILPWLVWLNGLSSGLGTKGSPVQFLIRAHAWVAGQVPSREHSRGNHTLIFLSLSFSLPPILSKNK